MQQNGCVHTGQAPKDLTLGLVIPFASYWTRSNKFPPLLVLQGELLRQTSEVQKVCVDFLDSIWFHQIKSEDKTS